MPGYFSQNRGEPSNSKLVVRGNRHVMLAGPVGRKAHVAARLTHDIVPEPGEGFSQRRTTGAARQA
jgi:hypothetical protein